MRVEVSYLHSFLVRFGVMTEVIQNQTVGPCFLVEVQQHLLFQLILPVVDCD